jgi:hypothetical protein
MLSSSRSTRRSTGESEYLFGRAFIKPGALATEGASQYWNMLLVPCIEAIERASGRKAVIERKPAPPGDVERTYADVNRAARDLSFSPRTSLCEGIADFVDWFRCFEGFDVGEGAPGLTRSNSAGPPAGSSGLRIS